MSSSSDFVRVVLCVCVCDGFFSTFVSVSLSGSVSLQGLVQGSSRYPSFTAGICDRNPGGWNQYAAGLWA